MVEERWSGYGEGGQRRGEEIWAWGGEGVSSGVEEKGEGADGRGRMDGVGRGREGGRKQGFI